MAIIDDILSWDERADESFGNAAGVLDAASRYVADVEDAVALARAWRHLGREWLGRQCHQLYLAEEIYEGFEDEESEDELVSEQDEELDV